MSGLVRVARSSLGSKLDLESDGGGETDVNQIHQ